MNGRYFTLLISLLVGYFILKWSEGLYGQKAASFSLFLFVFCPNLNAHAGFVTTDMYAALCTVAPCYYYWKLRNDNSWKYIILFGICLGLAQLVKQSLTILIFIFLSFELIMQIYFKTLLSDLKNKLVKLLAVVLLVLLIINGGFLFHQSLKPLGSYQFKSKTFHLLQTNLSFVKDIPLPFPSPYLQGLDQVKNMTEIGAGDARVSGFNYILGNKSKESFWYYYIVILLFKSPLIVILLIILLLYHGIRRRSISLNKNEFLILFVIVSFFVFLSFMVSRQVGLRHILLIYPLTYILLGQSIYILNQNTFGKAVLFGSVIYLISTFYYFFPNLIAYSNELLWDKKSAYKIMADSNLDWGQSSQKLNYYMQKHPEFRLPSAPPKSGKYILSVNDYIGLNDEYKNSWIRAYKPVSHLYFSYLVFDIK